MATLYLELHSLSLRLRICLFIDIDRSIDRVEGMDLSPLYDLEIS